jgi:hypothetical protein
VHQSISSEEVKKGRKKGKDNEPRGGLQEIQKPKNIYLTPPPRKPRILLWVLGKEKMAPIHKVQRLMKKENSKDERM